MLDLYILRHAKTDQYSKTGKDFDRELLLRGLHQAKEMARYLNSRQIKPNIIWCSSAIRTRQTYEEVKPAVGDNVSFLDEMYMAGRSDLLKLIWSEKGSESIMLIGHNNGISDLASYLIDDSILLQTCGFVHISFDLDYWSEVSRGNGKMVSSYRPDV